MPEGSLSAGGATLVAGPPPQDYAMAWEDYRRRMKLYNLTFLSLPCAFFSFAFEGTMLSVTHAAFLDSRVSRSFGIVVLAVLFVCVPVWLLALFYMEYRADAFPCPRCGQCFFARSKYWVGSLNLVFKKTCWHCGLPKWAMSDPSVKDKGITAHHLPQPKRSMGL